jgi:hypothetical protein
MGRFDRANLGEGPPTAPPPSSPPQGSAFSRAARSIGALILLALIAGFLAFAAGYLLHWLISLFDFGWDLVH